MTTTETTATEAVTLSPLGALAEFLGSLTQTAMSRRDTQTYCYPTQLPTAGVHLQAFPYVNASGQPTLHLRVDSGHIDTTTILRHGDTIYPTTASHDPLPPLTVRLPGVDDYDDADAADHARAATKEAQADAS